MPRANSRRHPSSGLARTTQIIYGERHNLQSVLRMMETTEMPDERRRFEAALLRSLVLERTGELNTINSDWDSKARLAANRRTPAAALRRLASPLPREDYYMARLLSEHPNAPAEVLAQLARHPYHAARENVARHPRTPAATLRALARDRREALWQLVAFNPGAPEKLRTQLRERLKRQAEKR